MARRELAAELGIMALAAFVLAIAGPFGTFAAPLWLRFADWLLFAIGGYAFFRPVIAAGEALATASTLPRWATIAFACALAAFPTTILVCWALSGWTFGRIAAPDLFGAYPQVMLVGGVVTAIQVMVGRRRAALPADPPEAAAPSPPAASPPPPSVVPSAALFLDRLPPALGRDLLAVENEDHYVRVHTSRGDTLLLMRLRDAVAELDGIDGARVHRGWWVARAAVAEVIRRDRAVALRLTNGREVPVARAEAPALRAAGWF